MPKTGCAKLQEGFDLYYEYYNEHPGKPTIIFAHGNGNSVQDWHTLGYFHKLKNEFNLVFMDALGYGESSKPKDQKFYTPKHRAEDVIAVLDHLKLTEPVHFFGASVGGSLGFVLMDLFPERFASFMIGAAHPYGKDQPVGYNLFGEEFRDILEKKGTQGFVDEVETKYLGRQFIDGVRQRYLQNDAPALIAANTPEWPNRVESLKKINVPVLLFAGEKDPVQQFQADIAKLMPDADVEVRILQDKDHSQTYWEGGGLIAPMVQEFMVKHFPQTQAYSM